MEERNLSYIKRKKCRILPFKQSMIIQEAQGLYYDVVSLNYSLACIRIIYLLCDRFLVTDNKDIKDYLSSKYTYIVIYNSTIDHSDRISLNEYSQVAADSIIEMYLFSKCDIIVKTLHSSFGNTSQLIGGHIL